MRTVELDQYFTPISDARRFISIVDSICPMDGFDTILEPSAGSGSFFYQLPENKRIGLDLEPIGSDIIKMDFFDWVPPTGKKIAVIGNPPFGRRGSLAKKFFERCAEYSDVIAFILPAIFAKPSFTRNLNPYFHLEYSEYFEDFQLPSGKGVKVSCVFMVWVKKENKKTIVREEKDHVDFDMTHRHISRITGDELNDLANTYDFVIGQISTRIQDDVASLTKGSQFFIKDTSSHGQVREIFNHMNFDHLKQYAMGATSLSKEDVITEYKRAKNNLAP